MKQFKAYKADPAYRDQLLRHQAPRGAAHLLARERLAERRRERAAYEAIARAALADPATNRNEQFLARAVLSLLRHAF